jgi:hypothetical protein
MRHRHFPRICANCHAPMARQEDSCWACGTPWPVGVDKTIMFPAPLMSTIGELGAFLGRENRAATPSPIPTPVARAAHGNGDPTAES